MVRLGQNTTLDGRTCLAPVLGLKTLDDAKGVDKTVEVVPRRKKGVGRPAVPPYGLQVGIGPRLPA